MGFIVADSGSSKTDWAFVKDDGSIRKFKTTGLNPSYYDHEQMTAFMNRELEVGERHFKANRLYYYGAGCSGERRQQKMKRALESVFEGVGEIEVSEDLFGAARACLQANEGLIAILGTGSNIDYYDGRQLAHSYPSLGYLLADEGGGVHLGKSLLTRYLNRDLDEKLSIAFHEKYEMEADEIIVKLYESQAPNQFMASFSPFLYEHRSHDQIASIIKGCFREFFERQVCKYKNHQKVSMNFVGSIAHVYREFIEEVAAEFRIKMGRVLQSPIDEQVNFHLRSKE